MKVSKKDTIQGYYLKKHIHALKLRLIIFIPITIFAAIFVSPKIFFSAKITDNAMQPSFPEGTVLPVHAYPVTFTKQITYSTRVSKTQPSAHISRGSVICVSLPDIKKSPAIIRFFQFLIRAASMGWYIPYEKKHIIRRVIAFPGETIYIKNKQIYINQRLYIPTWPQYFGDSRSLPEDISPRDNLPQVFVPFEMLFILSDNWDNSADSRSFGLIPINSILGIIKK